MRFSLQTVAVVGLIISVSTIHSLSTARAAKPRTVLAGIGPAAPIRVEHRNFTSTVVVGSIDGRFHWSDIVRGISRAQGYDDSACVGFLPHWSFSAAQAGLWMKWSGCADLLAPHVHFAITNDTARRGEALLVLTFDRRALLESQRSIKAKSRKALLHAFSWMRGTKSSNPYGLVLDADWLRRDTQKNLIVILHGFNSNAHQMEPLLSGPRRAGYPCAAFQYPNDQPIAQSARLLSDELRRLGSQYPHRRITLITHSMGALVARETIENSKLAPGNVQQLIMVVPPNHGSALACMACGLDICEHLTTSKDQRRAGLWIGSIEDGLGEAAKDMLPGSPFLQQLNRRPRNAKVSYSIILGNRGPLTAEKLSSLRRRIADASKRSRFVRFYGSRFDDYLADLDEVVAQRGDGLVALKRGRLQGVEDVVVLPLQHLEPLQRPITPAVLKLHEEILQRLRATNRLAGQAE